MRGADAKPSDERARSKAALAGVEGWLARRCGLPSFEAPPILASSVLTATGASSPEHCYIRWWARHPDAGSRFDKAVRALPEMSDAALVATLLRMDYDGLLYRQHGTIVGHVFFQRHGTDLCAFSCSLGKVHRRSKLWATVVIDFVEFASGLSGINRARVGGGNHPITRGCMATLKPHAAGLGWTVSRDGWVDFRSRRPEETS